MRRPDTATWLARVLLACCAFHGCAPLAQGQGDAVQALFRKAAQAQASGDLPAAIQAYQAVIRTEPRLPEAYNNLGALLYDTQQFGKAAATLRQCLKLNPRLASARIMLGASLLAMGDAKAARPELEAASATDPGDARTQSLLLQDLLSLGDDTAAARLLQRRVDHNPQDQEALYQLGRVYLALSQKMLLQARAVQPDSAVSHLMQGEIDEGMGNFGQAEAEYSTAVAREPNRAEAHEHLGNVYWQQGLWAKARTEFNATLQLDPTDCSARWKSADTLLNEHEQTAEALTLLNTAVATCPHLDQARVDRAKALIELQRPGEALPDLLAAEKNSPEEPSIHFLLARVYRAQDRPQEAAAESALFAKWTAQASTPAKAATPSQ